MRPINFCSLLLLAILTWTNVLQAQSSQKAFFGFGGGLDYGGLGVRAEFQPQQAVGFFAGFGYNLADPAYNTGLVVKLRPGQRIVPTVTAMYGYNAVIKLKYGPYNADAKSYYGPSVGAGCELYNKNKNNKWLFEVLVPFRSAEFRERYNDLKDGGVRFSPGILPVSFTIGYNFSVSSSPSKAKR